MSENDFQVVWLSDGEIYIDINFLVQTDESGGCIPKNISKKKLNNAREKIICKFINGNNNVQNKKMRLKEALLRMTNLRKFIFGMCEDKRLLFFDSFLKIYKKFHYHYPKHCIEPSIDNKRNSYIKIKSDIIILLTVLYNLQHDITNTLTCNSFSWDKLPTCGNCNSYIKTDNVWSKNYCSIECCKADDNEYRSGIFRKGISNHIFNIKLCIKPHKFMNHISFHILNKLYGNILRLLPDININYPKTLTQKYLLQAEMPSVLVDIIVEYLPYNED